MFSNPSEDARGYPKGVDPKGDDDEEQPLQPQAKQVRCQAGEDESVPKDERVFCAPTLKEHEGEGKADAEGAHGDERGKNCSSEVGGGSTVKP